MSYEMCTTYDAHRRKETARRYLDISAGLTRLVTTVDASLEWVTEKLDRKFVSAMESTFTEDQKKKHEMKLFQRAVLILLCTGLGGAAMWMKVAVESSQFWSFFG